MHLSDFDPTTVTTSGKAIMDLPQRAEATIDAWCDELFASLPRRDQRQKAVTYVKGLLRVTGRKSVRNIARSVGAGANEQQLHHFVSDSTWDWRPVRRALAGRLAADAAVQAWLVRPIDVQKAGEHSVGVSRRFCIEHGRTLNTQRAVGVWAASTAGCVPVAHRILLPTAWTADDRRRTRAGIPSHVHTESVEDALVTTCDRVVPPGKAWPLLVDARWLPAGPIVRRLLGTEHTFAVRVPADHRVTVGDRAMTGWYGACVQVHQLAAALGNVRRPLPLGSSGAVFVLAACVGVAPAAVRLVVLSRPQERRPAQYWLTNLAEPAEQAALALGMAVDRREPDDLRISDQVGLRDYAGRSFGGWHRHTTLACIAHAALARELRAVDVSRSCAGGAARHRLSSVPPTREPAAHSRIC